MQAFGVFTWPALCLHLSSPLRCGCVHLDYWVGVDLHMSMLLVRDDRSGACTGLDQGSLFGYEVVHI
ncbi:hypothetical protein ACE6H2_013360 [Prunus campanulata]